MVTSTDTMIRVQQVATGVAGSPYYLTGYFNASTGAPQDCAAEWRKCIGDALQLFVAPYAYLPITSVDLVDPATGNVVGVEPVSIPHLAFTLAEDPLPPATSLLLRWRTGEYIGGREIRGRTNIARLSESANTAGQLTASSLTAWQARQTALLAHATVEHVVWSPKNGVWAPTISGTPWNQFAVLRSRRD